MLLRFQTSNDFFFFFYSEVLDVNILTFSFLSRTVRLPRHLKTEIEGILKVVGQTGRRDNATNRKQTKCRPEESQPTLKTGECRDETRKLTWKHWLTLRTHVSYPNTILLRLFQLSLARHTAHLQFRTASFLPNPYSFRLLRPNFHFRFLSILCLSLHQHTPVVRLNEENLRRYPIKWDESS